MVHSQINEGQSAIVFSCTNLDTSVDHVIKFQKDHEMLAQEINTNRKIIKAADDKFDKKRQRSISRVAHFGILVIKDFDQDTKSLLMGYFVMPRYGENLHEFLVS